MTWLVALYIRGLKIKVWPSSGKQQTTVSWLAVSHIWDLRFAGGRSRLSCLFSSVDFVDFYFCWEIIFKNLGLKIFNLPITLCHKGDMFIFTLFYFSHISVKAVPLRRVLISHLHKNCYVISYNKFIAILWKILTSWMTTSLFLQR